MADPNTVTYTMLSALDVAGKWSLAAAVASSAAIALDVVSSNTASQPHTAHDFSFVELAFSTRYGSPVSLLI